MTLRLTFFGCALLPFVALACGTILGIDDPKDRPPSLAMSDGAPAPVACAGNEKMCSGICVATSDPKVGCAGPCTACASPQNGKASCVGGACGLTGGDCNPGFGDCDSNPANGCEAQLTTKAACGACGIKCPVFCAPTGTGSFGCTTTCSPPNVQCGMECVDAKIDPKHCGASCVDCTVSNGAGTCANSTCSIVCNAPYCHVGNSCVASDAQHCYSAACGACGPGQVCDNLGGTGCVACTQSSTSCGPSCTTDCTVMGQTCDPTSQQCIVPRIDGGVTCFIAGTPITLASGATKPIEEIEVGDDVLSYDTTTGTKVAGRVAQLFVHPHTRRLARLNGIVTTPEHRFYVSGTWVAAGALSIGDPLSLATITDRVLGAETLATEQASELLLMTDDVTTYNFEVAVFHDYFAGRYLVHNIKTY